MKHLKLVMCTALLCAICLTTSLSAQSQRELDSLYVVENYQKFEYQIPMRDGVKLFAHVYVPKDDSRQYPILMHRTCYSVRPYGADKYRRTLGPSSSWRRDRKSSSKKPSTSSASR